MKRMLHMILFVTVLGSVLTTALLLVDAATAPVIARNEQQKFQMAILAATAISFTQETIEETYRSNIEKVTTSAGLEHFVTREGIIAIAFAGSGLWGPIRGIVSLSADKSTILGLTIIHQEETPGLGGRIGEAEFLNRFRNVTIEPAVRIRTPGTATTANEVDGISGATLSCNAFEDILNATFTTYLSRR